MKGKNTVLGDIEVGKMIRDLNYVLRDIIKRELIPKQS